MHEREVFVRYGFEVKLILAVCGPNSWISKREDASSYYAIPSGTWPLDMAPKRRFKEIVAGFRFDRSPRHVLLDSCPAVPLCETASINVANMEWLKKDFKIPKKAFPVDDLRHALAGNEVEFRLLLEGVKAYKQWGYEVAVPAYDPSSVQKKPMLSALETVLSKKPFPKNRRSLPAINLVP